MKTLKKCWLTKNTESQDMHTLTLESAHPEEHLEIIVQERTFPDKPTKKHPLRHTVVLGYFSMEDLTDIRDAINAYFSEI